MTGKTWLNVLELVKKKARLSNIEYDDLLQTEVMEEFDKILLISIPFKGLYLKQFLQKYTKILTECVREETGIAYQVNFLCMERSLKKDYLGLVDADLRYCSDNFIVSHENIYAQTAIKEVAKKNCNILIIKGDLGTGKTHLVYSLVNELKKEDKDCRVVVMSAYKFADYVCFWLRACISDCLDTCICDKFSMYDAIVLEDMHNLKERESMLSYIVGILISLVERGVKIVVTTEEFEEEFCFQSWDEKLLEKFENGLCCGIESPGNELRKKILKQKISEMGVSIEEVGIDMLIKNTVSVNHMVSVLRQIKFYSEVFEKSIDTEMIEHVIKSRIRKVSGE